MTLIRWEAYQQMFARAYSKNGIKKVIVELFIRLRYICLRYLHNGTENKRRWSKLKNKFQGKRVFLIGNGPSLNKTPLYFLKNEYKMCFNHFYLMLERLNWSMNFYASVDNLVLDDLTSKIDTIASKSDFVFLPDIHFRGTKYVDQIDAIENLYWLEPKAIGNGFSEDLPKVYGGGSVIFEGMQILRFLGFKEIILIGVDMNFKIHENVKYLKVKQNDIESIEDDDPNHFDPRYFGKGKRYHQPEKEIVNHIFSSLKYINSFITEDFKIINGGYDSKVDFFPKMEFAKLFDFSKSKIMSLFDECIESNTQYSNFSELLTNSKLINSKKKALDYPEDFNIDQEEALDLIKKKIFTHLPLGPFNGKFYFVKRVES